MVSLQSIWDLSTTELFSNFSLFSILIEYFFNFNFTNIKMIRKFICLYEMHIQLKNDGNDDDHTFTYYYL